ncbi:MAG: hypothetical protein R2762_28830, partial [Bryobacteraceae bacterium]
MRKAIWTLGLVALPSWALYTYVFTDSFSTSINTTNWTINGSITTSSGLLRTPGTSGSGSIIGKTMPGGDNEYEVRTRLTLPVSGGTFITYFRASSNAQSGPSAQGSYYAVELQSPVVSGSSCGGTLAIYKRVSNVITTLYSTYAPCRNGMEIRVVNRWGWLSVFLDGQHWVKLWETPTITGFPGVGVRDVPSG